MGSFLSLLELASSLCSPLCAAAAEEEGPKEGILYEMKLHHMKGARWRRISGTFSYGHH